MHDGYKPRPHNNLDIALSTMKATPNHEHHKLPKNTTTHMQAIHESWHQYIDQKNLPSTKSPNYENATTHPTLSKGANKRHKMTHVRNAYMTQSEVILTSYDVVEIQGHKHLSNQTAYLVTQ
jgi:hypothetical protein